MHIQSATFHIANLTLTSAQQLDAIELQGEDGLSAFGDARHRALLAQLDLAQAELAEERLKTLSGRLITPLIGQPWQGQGGIYAGWQLSEDKLRNEHVILTIEEPDGPLSNADGIDWAKGLDIEGHRDFQMFDTREGALLYANLKHLFDHSKAYWTRTQCSAHYAFVQYFRYGHQIISDKKAELRVRAVRRFAA